jgi:hypothetical protein
MHAISIYEAWASRSWRLTSGRLDFECTTCLMNERVRTGIHIVRTVATVFPYLCFGKKSYSWSNTEWRSNVLLKRPDGYMLEQFEASWHRGRLGWKVLVIRMDDTWIVESLDGISCRPDCCKGTELTALNSAQNFLEVLKLECRLLNKTASLYKKHHYIKVILSNRM